VADNRKGVLKVELHAHTDRDPDDRIPHTTRQLIDRAAALEYGAVAVTLHDRYFDPAEFQAYARDRGVVLIAGIERTIAGRHVLLVNFPPEAARVETFADLAALKARTGGLVVAPHPFYPVPSALRSMLNRHADLFDAIEVNAMHTRLLDFNRAAVAWARRHGKPLVGNTDLHVLDQMGSTYSLVDAAPDPDAICRAIRAGRVEVRATPLPVFRAARFFALMELGGALGRLRRRPRPARE
jgi:predicted metal-dependent phosphoesterase TrpH